MAVLVTAVAFSQISYGVQARGLLSGAQVRSKYDIDFEKDPVIAPGGGVVAQWDLGAVLSLRGAINFQQQGVKLKQTDGDESATTSKARLNYIQVPVQAIVRHSLGNASLYAGAGGYAGYGFSGKIKFSMWHNTPDGGYTIEEKLKAFKKAEDDGADLHPFDAGLSGIAGVKLSNGVFVQLGYQYGLTNNSRDKEGKFRNRAAEITVGYFF